MKRGLAFMRTSLSIAQVARDSSRGHYFMSGMLATDTCNRGII